MTTKAWQRCAEVAARQHGVVTRQQAVSSGMTRRMIEAAIRDKRLLMFNPGAYVLGGTPITWFTKIASASLGAGKGSAASHRSAAALLGLDGFKPGVLELTSPRQLRWEGVVTHERPLPPRDVRPINGIPATTPTRTLLDLGAVVNLNQLLAALDSSLLTGKTSVSYLERRLDGNGRCPKGAGPLRRLLELRRRGQPPTESELERMYDRRVTRRFRLPTPEFQFRVPYDDSSFRIDFAYPSILLGVEVLGANPHLMTSTWQRDWNRHNLLVGLGWELLYYTWPDVVYRPAEVAHGVRSAIDRRTSFLVK